MATERLPLTSAQYGIWIGQQLDPDSPAYWTAEVVTLHGDLDPATFETALRMAVDECDALHRHYASDGQQVWQTGGMPDRWLPERRALDEAHARAWIERDLQSRADLERGPLFASALLQVAPACSWWYFRAHHIALDGFGYALLAQRVAALYSAMLASAPLPPSRATSIIPVVAEDQAYQASAARAADRAFWLARMKDALPPALLASPAVVAHGVLRRRGMISNQGLDAVLAGGEWTALMVAAFGAWLQHQSGARELTIGLPVMGRLGSVALSVPCMAMNIVPLRLNIDPDTSMAQLAREVGAEMRSIRRHQRFRYEHLKQELGLAGGGRRLFGAVINIMPFDRPRNFGPLASMPLPFSAGPVEDLSLTIAPGPDGIRCDLEANPNAYTETGLGKLHASLLAALPALLLAPQCTPAEILGQRTAPTMATLSGPPLATVAEHVLDALQRNAREKPAHIAVEHDGQQIDYATLLARVQQLAGQLRDCGIGQESRVALLLPREPRTIVALLAVLWAGAAYIPLDPEGPSLRIAAVLEDATPALVLTLRAHVQLAGARAFLLDEEVSNCPVMTNAAPVPASALAYVIYTSGSTGRPNGVMIERGALAAFAAAAGARYRISARDRVLQFAPLHFDASVEEIFLPLCAGATLVLRNEAMIESLPAFMEACAQHRITVLDLPTAFWHELAYSVAQRQTALPDSVRLVIIGGEAAMAQRVAQWRANGQHALLLNTYGPTEATVICTTAVLAGCGALELDQGALPIGQPLAGVDIAVVDAELRPVALGQEGELCLMGPTLARGYLGRPELSAHRFTALTALDGAPRAYRTGDRVVLDENRQLRYLGRMDQELKISGTRVDPLEIEAALLQYPGMRDAAVVARSDNGSTRLAAFVVAALAPAAALRAFLGHRLAAAAIPASFTAIDSVPRNRNGKIDRSALRELAAQQDASEPVPATPLEQSVMNVWREVLGIVAVNPSDDFFSLGGRSMQAIQVANRLGIALGREVSMSALFRHPTVTALAQSLDTLVGHAPPPAAIGAEYGPLLQIQAGSGPALFCIHPAEGLAWCYLGLARHLPLVPIHGVQARGLTDAKPPTINAMVDDYTSLIRKQQPHGPYHLLGWSSGGGLAHALAVRLRAAGEEVDLLAMMDSYPSDIWHGKPAPQEQDALAALLDVIGASDRDEHGRPLDREAMLARFRHPGSTLGQASDAHIARMTDAALHTMNLYRDLHHQRFDGDLLFFHALERGPDAPDWQRWVPYVAGRIEKVDIGSSHNTMSRPAPLAHIGRVLAQRLIKEKA